MMAFSEVKLGAKERGCGDAILFLFYYLFFYLQVLGIAIRFRIAVAIEGVVFAY